MSETPRGEREKFQTWATEPPREWEVRTFPADFAAPGWPGQYLRYHVQCAWEAWQAAHNAAQARIAKLEGDASKWIDRFEEEHRMDMHILVWDDVRVVGRLEYLARRLQMYREYPIAIALGEAVGGNHQLPRTMDKVTPDRIGGSCERNAKD